MAPSRSTMGSKRSKLCSALNPLTWRSRLGLDSHTFLMMMKGALPPTVVIAIHQSDAVADITLTIGYLAALMSVVAQALMPRAKFMKIMLFILLLICHNTPPDAPESVRTGFNSDACVVSGIWLVVMIWASNTLRAWRPMELQDLMVAFLIFSSVTITRAGTFVTVTEGLQFITRLLKGFMIGFAIATGVSLFIMPITSRDNVFHDVKGYVVQINAVLQAQIAFVKDRSEVITGKQGLLSRTRTARSMQELENNTKSTVEAKKKCLRELITKLNALHGKLQSDLFYSKDEIAWGKLSADDLSWIRGLLRSILLLLAGIAMLLEILDINVHNEVPRSSSGVGGDKSDKEDVKNDKLQKVVETL